MTSYVGVNHDLRRNNGRTIYMPAWFQGEAGWGNLAMPNVYKADGSAALYPAGTKYQDGERIFYYSKYIGSVTPVEWAQALQPPNSTARVHESGRFLFAHVFQQDYADGDIVRHIADELSVAFQSTTLEARAKDYYSGGWVSGKDTGADNRPFSRYITKHDYAATGSATQKIWNTNTEVFTVVDLSTYSLVSVLELDQSVIEAKTTMATTIMPNPWKNLVFKEGNEYDQYAPAMGAIVPNEVDQNDWAWVQTYGPMFIPWAMMEFAGGGTGEVMYKISGDGSTSPQYSAAPGPADGSTWQVAGHSMASTIMESSSGQDEERVMMFLLLRR